MPRKKTVTGCEDVLERSQREQVIPRRQHPPNPLSGLNRRRRAQTAVLNKNFERLPLELVSLTVPDIFLMGELPNERGGIKGTVSGSQRGMHAGA